MSLTGQQSNVPDGTTTTLLFTQLLIANCTCVRPDQLSVPPLCSLCLCGECLIIKHSTQRHREHRDCTEKTHPIASHYSLSTVYPLRGRNFYTASGLSCSPQTTVSGSARPEAKADRPAEKRDEGDGLKLPVALVSRIWFVYVALVRSTRSVRALCRSTNPAALCDRVAERERTRQVSGRRFRRRLSLHALRPARLSRHTTGGGAPSLTRLPLQE
jgi:hypothetical protein